MKELEEEEKKGTLCKEDRELAAQFRQLQAMQGSAPLRIEECENINPRGSPPRQQQALGVPLARIVLPDTKAGQAARAAISKPIEHHRVKLNADSYSTLYRAVTVCRTCFLVYSLVNEYFTELDKAMNPKDSGWVHSEKVLSRGRESEFFVMNAAPLGKRPSQPALALPEGTETKKAFLMRTISEAELERRRLRTAQVSGVKDGPSMQQATTDSQLPPLVEENKGESYLSIF